MKRFLYLLLSLVCFLALVSCQHLTQSESEPIPAPPPITTPAPPSPEQTVEVPSPPRVSRDRLKQHLTRIATERYSDTQRQDTRLYIESVLADNGWSITEQTFPNGINIIAQRPNIHRGERELIIGAHYDSVRGTPGADDNATGVAAVLELSTIFRDYDAPQNLKLVLFDLEEKGGLGSIDYVQRPDNIATLNGAIILEMLGYTCHTAQCQGIPPELDVTPPSDVGDFLSIIGDTEHPYLIQAFREVTSPLELFSLDVPFKGLLAPILLRSDHAPFWLKGKGAVMVSDTAFLRNPHYHRDSDKTETIDLDFFANSTGFVAEATATLLYQPELLKKPPQQS